MTSPGDIFDYSYLWVREAQSGEESGRKLRPCCLAIASRRDPQRLFLFSITSQRPPLDRPAYAFTELECRRVGLMHPAWLILDEYNVAASDYLTDFGSLRPRGRLTPGTLRSILSQIRQLQQTGRLSGTKRDADPHR